jgi:acyl-CoA synthetase (AMP-forming)/AMP-acid ligase II
VSTDPRTVPAALDRLAHQLPDQDALITEERTFTSAELRAEVHRGAAALIALGVQAGDRVAIWSPNTWHWVVACLAIHHAGAAMVPLNTRYTAEEAADILARTGAPVLFGMGRFLGNDRVADLDRAALPALRHVVRIPIEADDGTWDEFITRGADTTAVAERAASITPDDVSDILFTSGTTGRSKGVMCAHRQSLSASASWAANGKITADDDAVTVATTCGRPFADFELRIDSSTPGESGEVLLRGPNVMLGYLDDPAATAAAIDADGWLHTGDIGVVDEAGNLRITDRLKDMYICGGFNVYPAEVEQVLARMDGVADAAVIGVPDERLGEVGRAFLVTRPGAQLDEESVIAYTREHLANFKAPRSVRFVDELPRNAGGKVVKPQLRELA